MTLEGLLTLLYILASGFGLVALLSIRRLLKPLWRLPFKLIKTSLWLLCCFFILIFAQQLRQYFPATLIAPIAQVKLTKAADQEYLLYLELADATEAVRQGSLEKQNNLFVVNGDLWQLDIRVITWHPLLAQLGFQTLFRLDRLSGRYHLLEDERLKSRSLIQLDADDITRVLWPYMAQAFDGWLFSSYYGSAVYAPMADAAEYSLYLSPTGLELKPANNQAVQALKSWQ